MVETTAPTSNAVRTGNRAEPEGILLFSPETRSDNEGVLEHSAAKRRSIPEKIACIAAGMGF